MKVDEDKCIGCGICTGLCPECAITMNDKQTKEVIWDPKQGGMAKIYRKITE